MNRMTITLTGCRLTPLWNTTQKMIQECLGDMEGHLTRISRKDGGCDYRVPGEYELVFLPFKGDEILIDFSVQGPPLNS